MVVLCGAVLALLYVALNTSFSFRFEERRGVQNYGMLRDALLSGQLHVNEPVDPRRLQAPDPLDPSLPYPFIGDMIIWKGHYYFQTEPLPGMIRALCAKLTGIFYPTGAIVIICILANLALLGGIFLFMRKYFFPDSPTWIIWFVLLSFALSGPQLYIASRPVFHHESVAMGAFFILGGLTLAIYGLNRAQSQHRVLILAGTFFGAAILCRVWLGLYSLIFVLIFAIIYHGKKNPAMSFKKLLGSLVIPIAAAIAVQLAYNLVRFDHPLDFGRDHVIFHEYPEYLYLTQGAHFFRLEHVPLQLYHYLLSLPLITSKIGILRFPIERVWVGDVMVLRELAISVFIMIPVLILTLPLPFLLRESKKSTELSLLIFFCVIAPLTMLMALSAYCCATARFVYDLVPLLFVLIFFNLVVLWNKTKNHTTLRRALVAGLGLLFVINCIMGILLGLGGIFTQA